MQKCEIYTDALGVGVSAMLTQCVADHPMPVAFYSRKLKPAEKNYSTIEWELLAIPAGLDNFKVYVSEDPVVIFSDHIHCHG